jgi:hypothetical protein
LEAPRSENETTAEQNEVTSRSVDILLARGRLRPFERSEEYHRDHERDDEAWYQVRQVVRRRIDERVPPFRGVRGEEDDAGEKVAEKAGQHRDDGAKDGSSNGGPEEASEPEDSEGQRVVEEHLHWVHHERIDGQIQQAVGSPRGDADPRTLAEGPSRERSSRRRASSRP